MIVLWMDYISIIHKVKKLNMIKVFCYEFEYNFSIYNDKAFYEVNIISINVINFCKDIFRKDYILCTGNWY